MRLEYISLTRVSWDHEGFKVGDYRGTVKFVSQTGETGLKLGPEFSTKILQIVAAELVAESRRLAENLTVACVEAEQTPALPDLLREQAS